jgi:heptosyltransferase I
VRIVALTPDRPMLPTPADHVCLLRLSAIGDTCHVVPLLRTLQHAWPDTQFTWIIGRVEARLMSLVPDVEFITVDKRTGLEGLLRCAASWRADVSTCCYICKLATRSARSRA